MFLQPDERVIIMQEAISPFTVEELIAMRGAGVKTVYLQGVVRWHDMQPEAGAPIDYTRVDGEVEKCLKAGLKALLPQLYQCPRWKPDGWYLKRTANSIPHPGSLQAADDIDEWTRKLIERYGGPEVQVVYSIPENGEFPDTDWPTNHHPIPGDVIAWFVTGRMAALAAQHGEIWEALHHYGNPPYIDPVFVSLAHAYPGLPHYNIQFTHFVHTWSGQVGAVQRARELYGIQTFGGSEYCQGMDRYLGRAKAERVWYFTCPNHSYQGEKRVQPWMVEAIGRAVEGLKDA